MKKIFKITPEYLTSYTNFHFTDKDWKFDWKEKDNIAKLQAEGSAKAFNLLIDKKIVLIADEVGMGKTFEALAVMTSLWKQKPNARILLYAPNEIVAKKWKNEYYNFIIGNYTQCDDIVKSSINNEALHKAVYCSNHIELMENINKKWISFFICKTSSLSGFLSPRINNDETLESLGLDLDTLINDDNTTYEEKTEWMYKLANKCNEKAYEVLSENNNPPFDLIVYDEAHYLRHTDIYSKTNRSVVANAFFSGRNIKTEDPYKDYKPLASKALLMTATPNHSSEQDVINMVSLFNNKIGNQSADKILKDICIRRFRRLNNKVKYEYREEIPEGVEIKTLQEKLFFAAYHKSLVLSKAKEAKKNKNSLNSYRVLFGYLEGFEFISNKNEEAVVKNKEEEEEEEEEEVDNDKKGFIDDDKKETRSGDYDTAEDSDLIRKLSEKYNEVYGKEPAHPKYERIIDDLIAKNENDIIEKKLVFVRRIPSVNVIASRLVDRYDEIFKEELADIVGAKKIDKVNLRKFFYNEKRNHKKGLPEEEEELNYDDDYNDDFKDTPKSELLNLFTKKKKGKYRYTDCSNFRSNFKTENLIFSIFFQPAADYIKEKYEVDGFYYKDKKRLYSTTIKAIRVAKLQDYSEKINLVPYVSMNEIDESKRLNIKLDTLLSLWRSKTNPKLNDAQEEYDKFSYPEKEGFSNYLETGVLFASHYIFKLYSYYYKLKRDNTGESLYIKFCKIVDNEMDKTGLSELISKAILSFKQFYKKELGLTEKKLKDENWRFLKNVAPAYPYSAHTKRPSIVKAFNTPFYPNTLIATSVLQEGVDLHYHCSEVIHYGIAWTPGDNEQRNGRVDRLFGKLNNDLDKNKDTTLPIRYPYLRNTLDQEQLQRFIYRKNSAEKLLDKLQNVEINKEIDLLEKGNEDWESFFNKPNKNNEIEEPYAVLKSDFENIDNTKNINKQNINNLKISINSILKTVFDTYGNEVYKNENNTTLVCAIKHIRDIEHNKRHQPVLIELMYYEQGISYIDTPVYILKIKTPLCNNKDCISENDLDDIYYDNPLLKINYSPDTKGLFKLYVSSELPIFLDKKKEINLSEDELISSIENVISFTDDLEEKILKVDIQNDEIIKSGERIKNNLGNKKLGINRKNNKNRKAWEINKSKKYYVMQKEIPFKEIVDGYIENHISPLSKIITRKGKTFKEVGLFKDDALNSEFDLFEKIIK